MSISRRKILALFPAFAIGFGSAIKAEQRINGSPNRLFGYQLPDDQSIHSVKAYVRSLALENERARKEALLMFHKAEQQFVGGATVTGYGFRLQHSAFLDAQENGDPKTPRNRRRG